MRDVEPGDPGDLGDSGDAGDPALARRFRVIRGGMLTSEQMAAIAVAVGLLVDEAGAPTDTPPAADEWALQGRMHALRWQPLAQRWPGEPPGRAWRRVLD